MRTAGILMPFSSLPARYGIGNLGKEAYRFIDFLDECDQSYWQILPMGPTGFGDSPYQSFSAFACSPYYIDPDILADEGYISKEDIKEADFTENAERVDYSDLYTKRFPLLKKACENVSEEDSAYKDYVEGNRFWIEDYALYMALKEENGMRPFREWERSVQIREDEAMEQAKDRLKKDIHFWKSVQFLFHQQWMKLRSYAASKNVKIIGDIPIYVSEDSCEAWMRPELFQTGSDGKLLRVAGCPPDDFSTEGQLWGNPLYDWDHHKETGYEWWIKRLEHWGCFYDVIRIDHFRGFSGYYSIPAGNINAVEGEWKEGPGKDLITAIKEKVPWLPIIAEDLGTNTEDVEELLKYSGFPGMKVLQFAFSSDWNNEHLPHNYEKTCVAYTGTHDNASTEEWVQTAPEDQTEKAKKYLSVHDKSDLTDAMIRAVLASTADMAVIPIQDWLRTGAGSRINTPSTIGENWVWRVSSDMFTDELKSKIRELTEIYGRGR
ncbi:MAG: 4-alpha-glucanotransferase [Clostridiales bacterium]|nr:4-alpha-glucanotransferase [Clostridiales bacterium]